ncbi:putative tetratricopeptide-like helical domain superfamily [Helianthus anomalus]
MVGYCLRGEMIKAKKNFFDSLTLRGLVPDVLAYNSLLNGFCKNLNIEKAMQMFHEMTAM